jgi:sigma-B regulation protein RsbU (phosphoserine phosphatase)
VDYSRDGFYRHPGERLQWILGPIVSCVISLGRIAVDELAGLDLKAIIDSLGDGIYLCNLDRTITYWSKSAERITGWLAEDVVGRQCFDNILCHVDKDGHRLCGEEYCPLHRSMVTGTGSKGSLLVYARGKDGQRVPMQVVVAPIRNDAGEIIGGIETFRDATETVSDLERAKAIQRAALQHEVPSDARILCKTHYVPQAVIGGDYYAIESLDNGQYAVMLADVMGHGIAAALYTIHLRQLWERYHDLLKDPVEFATNVNQELAKVIGTDESFATAVCGLIDLKQWRFRFVSAGGPAVMLVHADGSYEQLISSGLPLALLEDALYEETNCEIRRGDNLLLFSDGAIEIHSAEGEMLGVDGLVAILKQQDYPRQGLDMSALEEELLRYSNAIRLEDDLSVVEIRIEG